MKPLQLLVASLFAFGPSLPANMMDAEEPKSSPAFEEYRQQRLKALEPTIQAAEKAGRIQTITNLANEFRASGKAGLVRVLIEGNYLADEIVPTLISLLDHTNVQAKGWALVGLRRHGTNAVQASDKMLKILKGENDLLAARAAEAFITVAPPGEAAVAPLLTWLESGRGELDTRLIWIGVLRDIGPRATAALPFLESELKAVDHPFLTNRTSMSAYAAFQAIGRIQSQPALERDELLRLGVAAFEGKDAHRAFQSLENGVVSQEDAARLLHDLLRKKGAFPQRIRAVELLGQMRPRDSLSIGVLLDEAKQSESRLLADSAAAAVVKCAASETNSVQLLLAALNPEQPDVSRAASRVLVQAASLAAGPETVTAVTSALRSADGKTDFEALGGLMDVLRALGPKASNAQPTLVDLLPVDAQVYQGRPRIYSSLVRKYVLLTLADVGIGTEAIPAILDELTNGRHPENRAAAARAAGVLPEGHEVVVPQLEMALAKLDTTNEVSALNLNIIGSRSHTKGTGTSLPLEIIRALVRIGPAAKSSVPVLRVRAQDPPLPNPEYELPYQSEAARAAEILSR